MGERIFLTPEQALALLPDGDDVHVFKNPAGMLVGCNWSRAEVENEIRAADAREVGGDLCRRMGHGLVVIRGRSCSFIATRDDVCWKDVEATSLPAPESGRGGA